MTEAVAYWLTLALFSFVVIASARIRHDMWLLACIPPVFVALIVGFTMTLYAGPAFGVPQTGAALIAGGAIGWQLASRFQPRPALLLIYLAWTVALVLAWLAFEFPDRA